MACWASTRITIPMLAVANSLAAIEQGFTHVQGCINGYGERCGNANLTSIIANLELKMGHTTIGKRAAGAADRGGALHRRAGESADARRSGLRRSQRLRAQGRRARERGAQGFGDLRARQPEAGRQSAARAAERSFGEGNVLYKLKQHGLEDRLDDDARRELLDRIKQMEFQGYELEAAEGTFELLVREALRPGLHFFEVVRLRGHDASPAAASRSTATVTLKAQDGVHSATASGNGPVNALDLCLRKCLSSLYPRIADVRLTDYKVRVLDTKKGTAARCACWSSGPITARAGRRSAFPRT